MRVRGQVPDSFMLIVRILFKFIRGAVRIPFFVFWG